MITVAPSLIFKRGQCNQAIEFYQKAFDAEVVLKMLFSDADPKDFQFKDEEKDLIYHCQLMIGEQIFLLTDDANNVLKEDTQPSILMSLCMTFESADEVNAAYKSLSNGATIVTPICSTTYCSCYVLLVDKFGMQWELMTDQAER